MFKKLKFSELIYLGEEGLFKIDSTKELISIVEDWHEAAWAPEFMQVVLGCECGCGGDLYTAASWKAEMNAAYEKLRRVKEYCLNNNIIYDEVI
jgi:hypothetical protein